MTKIKNGTACNFAKQVGEPSADGRIVWECTTCGNRSAPTKIPPARIKARCYPPTDRKALVHRPRSECDWKKNEARKVWIALHRYAWELESWDDKTAAIIALDDYYAKLISEIPCQEC